jgi:Tfp pilus assembly protein PilO
MRDKQSFLKRHGTIVLAALVVLAFGVAPLVFNYIEQKSLQQRIDAAESELGMDRTDVENLTELRRAVSDLEERLGGSQQYVPESPELAQALRGVTRALNGFAPSERSIETQPTRHYKRYSVIPIFVRFEGDFVSAYGTLRSIEELSRLFRVERLSIRRDNRRTDQGEPRTEVDLELSTFYTPGKEATP